MSYDIAITAVLKHEGGYQSIAADNGNWSGGKRGSGALIGTNRGISAPTLISWRKEKGYKSTTATDMRNLSLQTAKMIYRKQYAMPIRFDDLPSGLDYCVFDCAVHAGVRRASQFLQRVIGAKDDGFIGVNTMDALAAYVKANGVSAAIDGFQSVRLAHLKRLKTWAKFGRGWQRRVNEVARLAKQLDAQEDDFDWLEGVDRVDGKAEGASKKPAKDMASDAGYIGGAGAVVSEAAKQIEPLAQTSQILQYAFVALLVIGVGLTAYSLIKRKQDV
jgi:lysozyme family protein